MNQMKRKLKFILILFELMNGVEWNGELPALLNEIQTPQELVMSCQPSSLQLNSPSSILLLSSFNNQT